MRAVVQRVKQASVAIDGTTVGEIPQGLMVLLGVGKEDTSQDATYLAEKIVGLRIFTDAEDKMNLSVLDIGGEILVVSQFTLYADCRKGKRPGFSDAALPETAIPLYEQFVIALKEMGLTVATGQFGADMLVSIENDGPVTILLDSKKVF
ncbi:MAG: D-tyrosyl-tRNA(Tyr) deacylase [Peptococcaceae bacterium]|jgi:D-tyrosyl-tRNA(Tyr) deacylase|nr:D-tyrosyl-tRNA(Tyr) deacylase [Peptococcaceae bacterium]